MKNVNSQKASALKALSTGKNLTAAQLASRHNVTSTSEVIRQLRADGYAVYTNTDSSGKTTYRLGTPSRSMIAAAYNLSGSALFTR